MKKSKNGYLNKIIIYKFPIIDRIINIFSFIFFIILGLICIIAKLYNNSEELVVIIIILLFTLVFSVISCFSLCNSYICFDIENNKIIISDGLKKKELGALSLISISVGYASKYSNNYTLNFNYIGFTIKNNDWLTHSISRPTTLFYSIRIQVKRLKKFCEECNRYLSSRQK